MLPKDEPNGQPTRPPTFEDGEGNTWQIKITLGLADEVLEETQIDLIPDTHDVSPIVAVALTSKKMAHLLWVCIRRQADSKGVSEKQFKASLAAEELQGGWLALREAVLFFIRTSRGPSQADAAEGMFDAAMKYQNAQAQAILETYRSSKTEAVMKELFQEVGKEVQAEMKRTMQHELSTLAGSASKQPA